MIERRGKAAFPHQWKLHILLARTNPSRTDFLGDKIISPDINLDPVPCGGNAALI